MQFDLNIKYLVFKLEDLKVLTKQQRENLYKLADVVIDHRIKIGLNPLDCLVVENNENWNKEYEQVKNIIRNKVVNDYLKYVVDNTNQPVSPDLKFGDRKNDDQFLVLGCGEYNLMISDHGGDSSNYSDTYIQWKDTQKWVDDNVNSKQLGGYNDWTVPNKEELNLMYKHKDGVPDKDKFFDDYYWSSSEFSTMVAWHQYFINGVQIHYAKSACAKVRAVRRIPNN